MDSQPQLYGAEAAGEELLRLVRNLFRCHQAKTAAVVSEDRLRLAAEKRRKRYASRERERVPCRDVEPGHRHADHALHTDQHEALRKLAPKLCRHHAVALDHSTDLAQHVGHRGRGRAQIAEQIGATGNPLLGFQIDQEQWRPCDPRLAGAKRIGHPQLDAD